MVIDPGNAKYTGATNSSSASSAVFNGTEYTRTSYLEVQQTRPARVEDHSLCTRVTAQKLQFVNIPTLWFVFRTPATPDTVRTVLLHNLLFRQRQGACPVDAGRGLLHASYPCYGIPVCHSAQARFAQKLESYSTTPHYAHTSVNPAVKVSSTLEYRITPNICFSP